MDTSETERMKKRLAGFGLREVPTPQDGNCQFASVAHQLFGDSILPWDSDKVLEFQQRFLIFLILLPDSVKGLFEICVGWQQIG